MKKFLIFAITALLSLVSLSGSAFAKDISTLNIVNNGNKLTVSGTAEDGVHAVAVLVYSGDNLAHMETCPATNSAYSCMLDKTFEDGDYVVKVADYDGGDYKVKNITLSSAEVPEEEAPKAPDTGHETFKQVTEIIASTLALCVAAGLTVAIFFGKKLLHKK